MAQPRLPVGIRPRAGAAAHHTLWLSGSCLTGHLPRPLDQDPLRAGLRRLLWQRGRRRLRLGRLIPYASATRPVLALVASIVLATVRRLLMAGFGSLALLAPSRLAAAARAVAMAAVAAAADGKRTLAAPAVAPMKNRNLVQRHGSLQAPALWTAAIHLCEALNVWFAPRPSSSGSRNNGKPRQPPGFSSFCPHRLPPAYPTHPTAALRAG